MRCLKSDFPDYVLLSSVLAVIFFAANQNLNADLIVVGAGSAGLSAAVQGAKLGKK